jgi:hypothetical protein
MAAVEWMILCERAIIEAQAGTVSMMALVENVTLQAPPKELTSDGQTLLVPFRFYAVQQWLRSRPKKAEKPLARMLLVGPNNKELGHSDFTVDLSSTPKARVIIQSGGFPLMGEGPYKCVVQAKIGKTWRTLASTEFSVVFLQGAPIVKH